MSTSSNIAPCYLIGENLGNDGEFSEVLAQRLRADGSEVEVLNGNNVFESLSLNQLSDESDQLDAICFLLVQLQKNNVIAILDQFDLPQDQIDLITDNLEKETIVLHKTPDSEQKNNQNLFHLDTKKGLEDEVERLVEQSEHRGHFEESVSEHRDDEEVTDRLKNLGYI